MPPNKGDQHVDSCVMQDTAANDGTLFSCYKSKRKAFMLTCSRVTEVDADVLKPMLGTEFYNNIKTLIGRIFCSLELSCY